MGWAEEFVRTVERSGAERPARSSGKAAGDTVRRRNRAIRGYVVSLGVSIGLRLGPWIGAEKGL